VKKIRSKELAVLPELAAERHGAVTVRIDRPLGAWPGRGLRLDYVQFAELVSEAAGWLRQAGVGSGDRVAIVKANSPDIQIFLYACLRIGGVPALISASLGAESLQPMLQRLDPRLVVSDRATLTGPLRRLSGGWTTIATDGEVAGALSPADLAGHGAPAPVRPGSGAGLILHTSGTTGVPKLVRHSIDSLRRGAFVGWHHRSLRYAALRGSDTIAASLSWTHVRAVFGLAYAIARGCRLVAMSDLDEQRAAALLAEVRPTVFETHPNVLQYWRGLPAHPQEPFREVRMFVSTADAAHPATIRTLLRASSRRRPVFIQVYGMTEVGPVAVRVIGRGAARRMKNARNAGVTIPFHSRTRIVDDSGRRLPPGVAGIVQAKTSSCFQAYFGEEERTSQVLKDSWFATADRGRRTWSGRLHLLDRQTDHLPGIDSVVGVEDVLLDRLPQLAEVVVVDLGKGKPTPVICTVQNQPLDLHEWRAGTLDLPVLAEPLVIPLESLPLTATWKVRRFLLRARLLA
jgi:acyl-coenzyme A synthetase/AMP-(fatty) acid ligase